MEKNRRGRDIGTKKLCGPEKGGDVEGGGLGIRGEGELHLVVSTSKKGRNGKSGKGKRENRRQRKKKRSPRKIKQRGVPAVQTNQILREIL